MANEVDPALKVGETQGATGIEATNSVAPLVANEVDTSVADALVTSPGHMTRRAAVPAIAVAFGLGAPLAAYAAEQAVKEGVAAVANGVVEAFTQEKQVSVQDVLEFVKNVVPVADPSNFKTPYEVDEDGNKTGRVTLAFTGYNEKRRKPVVDHNELCTQYTFRHITPEEAGFLTALFKGNADGLEGDLSTWTKNAIIVMVGGGAAVAGIKNVFKSGQSLDSKIRDQIDKLYSQLVLPNLTRRQFLQVMATVGLGAGGLSATAYYFSNREAIDKWLDGFLRKTDVGTTLAVATAMARDGGYKTNGSVGDITPQPTYTKTPFGEATVTPIILLPEVGGGGTEEPTPTATGNTIYFPFLQYDNNINTQSPTPTATGVVIEATTTPSLLPPTETPTPTLIITPSATSEPTIITPEKPKFSKLRVEGAKFMEGGKEIILRGAVLPVLDMTYAITSPPAWALKQFKQEIDILKKFEANFVNIQWNSGDEFLGNKEYMRVFLEALQYARKSGLHVELSLHSRGKLPDSDPDHTWKPKQQDTLDRAVITDWQKLLKYPGAKAVIGKSVDIYGVLSEIRWYAEGPESITNPILFETAQAIRDGAGNQDAICSIGGMDYGRDASELLNINPSNENNGNIIVEIHPYNTHYAGNYGFYDWVNKIRGEGYAVLVGEFGQQDNLDYNKEMISFLTSNKISYSYYSIDILSEDPHLFYNKNGLTEEGKILVQKWGDGI